MTPPLTLFFIAQAKPAISMTTRKSQQVPSLQQVWKQMVAHGAATPEQYAQQMKPPTTQKPVAINFSHRSQFDIFWNRFKLAPRYL